MPHVTVEYSANIKSDVSTKVLMKTIHETLAKFSTFNLREIKSRCIMHRDFYMGDGNSRNAFVYLRLEMLAGRKLSLKKKIGAKLREVLRNSYRSAAKHYQLQMSVEIREISKKLWFKEL
jgi:5-carboxymethyl-2-hydroxymuconate isomerase